MIFMFVTTIAALLWTSYDLLTKVYAIVFTGADWVKVFPAVAKQVPYKSAALVGNTLMGIVGIFLVIAALVLAVEGYKAFQRYRGVKGTAAPSRA